MTSDGHCTGLTNKQCAESDSMKSRRLSLGLLFRPAVASPPAKASPRPHQTHTDLARAGARFIGTSSAPRARPSRVKELHCRNECSTRCDYRRFNDGVIVRFCTAGRGAATQKVEAATSPHSCMRPHGRCWLTLAGRAPRAGERRFPLVCTMPVRAGGARRAGKVGPFKGPTSSASRGHPPMRA